MTILMAPPLDAVQQVCPLYEIAESPPASGLDGKNLMEEFRKVIQQWNEGAEFVPTQSVPNNIRHVPLQSAGTIKVHFLNAVPMSPRHHDFEDDDFE